MRETIPDTHINSPLVEPYLERFKKEGPLVWGEVFGDLAERLNIKTEYLQETSESFGEMRECLNSEAGVLIANHPSSLDPCFILPPLKRPDVLMMLQRKRFPFFEETLGAENIVRAPKGMDETKRVITRVGDHIKSGGLFVLFPTGGAEMATGEIHFKSGFRALLSEMKPENMVYSFHIDETAGKKIMTDMVGPPRDTTDTSELFAPELHARPSQEKLCVEVDEAYSQVQVWQNLLTEGTNLDSVRKNKLLTQHYLEQFPR